MNDTHRAGGTPPGPRRFLMLTLVALVVAVVGYIVIAGLPGGDPAGSEGRQSATLLPEDASASRGEEIAQSNCASCHAIGRTGDSPNDSAPPFRAFHEMWPVEHLEEALAEGIMVGHAEGMPEFVFSTDQIAHFIAYLKTLEE